MRVNVNRKALIIYFIFLTMSIVFASFYGGAVAFVPLYALMLLIPVSSFYLFLNYKFLKVYQEIEVHRITKGQKHRFRAFIENAGFLPIHRMRLGLFCDRCEFFDIEDSCEVSLSIHEKKELFSDISCRYAGAYEVGIERVFFQDPFEIFEVEITIPYNFRAVVSPRIIDDADNLLDLENLYNSTGLKSLDLFEDIPGSDLRPYQRGDQLSAINWKISARLSQLMIRLPDRMENRIITLLLDAVNVPEREQDTNYLKKRDEFLELVISAAWHFVGRKVPITIVYPAGNVRESVIDSYESFTQFYNIVADGIFYASQRDEEEIHSLVDEQRSSHNDRDTWIIIKEDPGEGQQVVVCE